MNISIILIVLISAIVIVAGFFINKTLQGSRRNQRLKEFKNLKKKIDANNDAVISELQRMKQISKTVDSKQLYNQFNEEYEGLVHRLENVSHLFHSLDGYKNNTNDFNETLDELNLVIHSLNTDFDYLLKNIKNYTGYELENTRISLELKERVKELHVTFDNKIRYIESYNNSFELVMNDIQLDISKFEDLQKDGDYTAGREVLTNAQKNLENVSTLQSIIIDFHEQFINLKKEIENLHHINLNVRRLKFTLDLFEFDTKIKDFNESLTFNTNLINSLSFKTPVDNTYIKEFESEIDTLTSDILAFKSVIDEQYILVGEIAKFEQENDKLIQFADNLIKGATQEKQEIIKLYDLTDIKQMRKLEDEINVYAAFREDYKKLINIIYSAKEDYASSKGRIMQAHQYLVRLLKNLEAAILELRAFRKDEINARENITKYRLNLMEIDLYLRKYDHLYLTSENLQNSITDLKYKLNELEQVLLQEPLNIYHVRNLNDSVTRLINTLSDYELESDIKQRHGAILLINYINRYADNQEVATLSNRFNSLLLEHNYKRILQEAYDMLIIYNNDGKQTYKNIVSQVEIEPFEHIFTN